MKKRRRSCDLSYLTQGVNRLTFRYLLVAARQDVAVSTRLISHHLTTNIARHDTAAIPSLKNSEHFDVSLDHSTPFASLSLSHESRKQHLPATVAVNRADQRELTTGFEQLLPAADGRHRALEPERDPDLAAAGDEHAHRATLDAHWSSGTDVTVRGTFGIFEPRLESVFSPWKTSANISSFDIYF